MIHLTCPGCGLKLKVKDSLAGRSGKCPKCGAKVSIGRPEQTSYEEPEATADSANARPVPEGSPKAPAMAASDDPSAPIPFDSLEDDEPAARIILPGDSGLGIVGPEAARGTTAEPSAVPGSAPAGGMVHADGSHVHVPIHLDRSSYYLILNRNDVVARWQSDGRGWVVRFRDGFVSAATVAAQIPQSGSFLLVQIGVERREDGLHLRNVTPLALQEHYALNKLTHGDDEIFSAVVGKGQLNDRQRGHVRTLVHRKFLPHVWPELDELLAAHG